MKKTIICSALAFLGIQANAQVEDVSVTLSPTASYNWFDDNSAIKDGLMIGGRVGFGFGEYFELRALYEKSVDVKSEIDKLNIQGAEWDKFKAKFEARDVDVERIGGEMKANIPTGSSLAPYVTLGSGIQRLKHDGLKDEQIYLSLGLGTKINLSDRVVLNIEGKNTAYNLNSSNVLFRPSEASEFEKLIKDSKDDRMYNWSVLAGLQFYLGGRQPGSLTELDRAYLRKFSGGLSGFKFVIEPGVARINFNDDLNFKDTYLVGGTAGFDFNQFVGLRGFYYQATENKEFKKFDKLAMYGADVVAKLNVSRGLTPYITLGGGYLNAYSDYKGENPLRDLEDPSSYFVKGGLGLNVPVGQYLDVFGAANLLYTTSLDAKNLTNIQKPSELKKSEMYNVGLRFKLGAPANEDAVLERKLNSDKQVYEDRISELEAELKKAYRENDSEKAVRVIKEKQGLEKGYKKGAKVVLTPKELQELVEKTIDEVNEEYTNQKSKKKSGDVNQRIDRLERLLLEVNRKDYNNYQGGNLQNNATQEILNELRELNSKVDRNSDKISILAGSANDGNTVVVAPSNPAVAVAPAEQAQPVQGQVTPSVVANEEGETGVVKSLFVNEGISVDVAPIFGGGTSAAVGIRGHYGFTNSNWEFQPNLYVGVAGKGSFGANANAIYKFNIDKGFIVQPYLGAGVGYNKLNDNSKFGANLVVGTSFNVLDGKLYVDYTALNLADFNKISVGYKFGL